MHLSTLLDIAADTFGDRVAVGGLDDGLTFTALRANARVIASRLAGGDAGAVGLVAENSATVPTLLYAAGMAGLPFVPINYRLADDRLRAIIERTAPSLVVVDAAIPDRVGAVDGVEMVSCSSVLDTGSADVDEDEMHDVTGIAVLLFTSGTSGEPKAAVLRHHHLTSYVLGTVDLMSADESEATLVTVPPYHIAGISAIVTSTFAGRRLVYLPTFDPAGWVATVRAEGITHAMVVPTMLGRVLEVLERTGETLPTLRHLSYGGGRMPAPVIELAVEMLPHVDFVNAYGLTETSSTISVLGPEDHREALASDDPAIRRRLGSVGRPVPAIEVSIRDTEGSPLPTGQTGELHVRGEQVAGEYLDRDAGVTDGWFPTNDACWQDEAGFLYLEGRLDDVIVRGAENLSPGEIEDVLLTHPAVVDAGVFGLPDREWGERVVAAVVLAPGVAATEDELRDWVRARLRSTKTPEQLLFLDELPYTDTGKLLRRILRAEVAKGLAADAPVG